MADVVVTVPQSRWAAWVGEGDLPGAEAEYESHFMFAGPIPKVELGDRVYIVAWGLVRGYAPLVAVEERCSLDPRRHCFLREGGAEAVTPRCRRHHGRMWTCNQPGCIRGEPWFVNNDHPLTVTGFRGVIARWWPREIEMPFPDWQWEGVAPNVIDQIMRPATGSVR